MYFGDQYSDNSVHFIAGGKTLEAIQQYLADKENAKPLQQALAAEYGAKRFVGVGRHGSFVFEAPNTSPAFTSREKSNGSGEYYYEPNYATPEGKALQAKLDLIPDFDLTQRSFSLRLTGVESIATNPDNLQDSRSSSGPYREKASETAATFSQYGDTYVVSVPRVLRGIFNAESEAASLKDHYNQAAGWTFEWFTPPDSQQIPYSKVVELREKTLGDQLAPATVKQKVPAFSRDR